VQGEEGEGDRLGGKANGFDEERQTLRAPTPRFEATFSMSWMAYGSLLSRKMLVIVSFFSSLERPRFLLCAIKGEDWFEHLRKSK